MNIYYCHGFASRFDRGKSKVQTLATLGPVSGCNIDYTCRADEVVKLAIEEGHFTNIDLIVGTSMGGWLAATLGSRLGIPFVAINPSIDPSQTLRKYIGSGVDFQGQPYTQTESIVASYYPIAKNGYGLILLDEGDEVIDSLETQKVLDGHYDVKLFSGGNHRFEHMKEALPLIEAFHDQAGIVYGFGKT